jgi:hypothetical protein
LSQSTALIVVVAAVVVVVEVVVVVVSRLLYIVYSIVYCMCGLSHIAAAWIGAETPRICAVALYTIMDSGR